MKRIIPCLLKKNSTLVKTVQFSDPKYIGDLINTIRIFNNLEVDELVLLDIAATRDGKSPSFEAIEQAAGECFMPLAYGGGIKTMEEAKKIFSLGVEKIVISTQAAKQPSFIKEASDAFGSQSVIVSINTKKKKSGEYEVYVNSGTNPTGMDPVEFAFKMEQMGAGEIFLNSIDYDGKMEGYDLEIVKMVTDAISVPLIACGGAGNLSDINRAFKAGASAVAAGSIFVYQGRNRSVLVNFPTREEIKAEIDE